MKNILILICILTCSHLFSQSAPHESHTPQTDFQANALSAMQIQAFERRANQKLQDFGAALQVIGNAEYAMSMREKSKMAALKLFENDQITIKNTTFPANKKNPAIQHYLNYVLQNPQKMALQEITMGSPFRKSSNHLYQANYLFSWSLGEKKYPFSATLLLKKTTKIFGTEKKEVWEIVIGEIKEM